MQEVPLAVLVASSRHRRVRTGIPLLPRCEFQWWDDEEHEGTRRPLVHNRAGQIPHGVHRNILFD